MHFKIKVFLSFLILISSTTLGFANNIFELKGVNQEIEQNILSYLSTSNINCDSNDSQIEQVIESLPSKIRKATRPFGYYEPTVEIKQNTSKDCLKILISIELNKPILIDQIKITFTDENLSTQNSDLYRQLFPLKKGKVLIHNDYENFKSGLLDQASELGYLDAKFVESTIDVYPDLYKADVFLHFDTGLRYKVENIIIKQTPSFLSDEFILKFVSLKKDNYFTNSELFKLRKKLLSTGYFEQISIELDYEKKYNGLVPIIINLTPGDRIKYSTGVGFSTDIGPRLTFDYNQYRITEFGYQFNSKLSISNVVSEFTTGLKMPSKSKPVTKWYNAEAGYRIERSDTITSNTSKLGLSQTRIQENKWQNINYLDLVNEEFDTGSEQNSSTLLVPGTSWSYTQSDNLKIPLKGYKIQTDFKGASNAIASDVTFAQLNFSYKSIFPIKETNRLIFRAQLGTTFTSDFINLPSSFRYYTGGDNTVRGFNYNTLSPLDETGEAIGGKHLFVSSIEYEHRIADQWGLAVFSDTGNAFNDKFKLEKSIGTGLRWFSPIGPVRLDVGIPINDDKNDFQIHITVGPDF